MRTLFTQLRVTPYHARVHTVLFSQYIFPSHKSGSHHRAILIWVDRNMAGGLLKERPCRHKHCYLNFLSTRYYMWTFALLDNLIRKFMLTLIYLSTGWGVRLYECV